MAITSLDTLIDALGNSGEHLVVSKASIASAVAGLPMSLWLSAGTPALGAVPTAAAIPTSALAGVFKFTNPTGGDSSYVGRMALMGSIAATDVQFHDRLSHMGGLSGTVITAQNVGCDVSDSSLDARRGGDDYSDVQWWIEFYTATGTVAATATVTYTNAAGVSGRTTTVALAASRKPSMLFAIIGAGGEFIQSVQSVQLSISTGTAGNFGVTATRSLYILSLGMANSSVVADWSYLGLPRIEDNAAVFMIVFPGSTSTGTIYGSGKLIHG